MLHVIDWDTAARRIDSGGGHRDGIEICAIVRKSGLAEDCKISFRWPTAARRYIVPGRNPQFRPMLSDDVFPHSPRKSSRRSAVRKFELEVSTTMVTRQEFLPSSLAVENEQKEFSPLRSKFVFEFFGRYSDLPSGSGPARKKHSRTRTILVVSLVGDDVFVVERSHDRNLLIACELAFRRTLQYRCQSRSASHLWHKVDVVTDA